jgi:membrane-bound serine protease (ClpP class)
MRDKFFPGGILHWSSLALALALAFFLFSFSHRAFTAKAQESAPAAPRILEVAIASSISPVQAEHLASAMNTVAEEGFDLLLIRLDTPGGLGESMRQMVKSILNAPAPVIVWVGPSGARAASAGVFLVAAANVAAMSPQTTIGAASPVNADGGDLGETMSKKVINDMKSLLKGIAASRNRNVPWYLDAVEESVSVTAEEAILLRVVDLLAVDRDDLLDQIGRKGVATAKGMLKFDAASARVVPFEQGFRYGFLSWLLDPQIAYMLLLGGMAGLFFELATPGAVLPGVLGGLSLLLGLYAMSILPTNAAGLLLLLFGLVLFILEIHIVSYGLLSVAAVVSLFVGSIILFPESGAQGLPLSTIFITVIGVSLLIGGAILLAIRAQAQKPKTGLSALAGEKGVIKEWNSGRGKVVVHGEYWDAVAVDGSVFKAKDDVWVVSVDKMLLTVSSKQPEGAP